LLVFIGMCSVFSVVLVKLSVLAKRLAGKTPLKKPNCGEGIVSTKPRPKSVYDRRVYCIISLFNCMMFVLSSGHTRYTSYLYSTYSQFVLKLPLNTKQTNKRSRPLGRPSHTWLRAVEADLGQQNIGLASAWRNGMVY